ncbi:MAG: hypothetical protein K2I88_02765 [Anaeroplasmataceae bacterium]|nr:hypothetical protein [Anaeroplasmataceae bacterium]
MRAKARIYLCIEILSCDELFQIGIVVKTPFDNLLSFGDATTLWDLNESTLRKAILYGKLREGFDVMKYGKQWVITMEAMVRVYGELKLKRILIKIKIKCR